MKTDLGYMIPYEQRIPGSNQVIKMIPVPGGTIKVGRLDAKKLIFEGERPKAEGPLNVDVRPFWIGKYEITMGQFMPYRKLHYDIRRSDRVEQLTSKDLGDVDAVSAPSDVYDPTYNFEFAQTGDSAATTMSQFSARHYTKWLSLLTSVDYRLPLRSEWQHACAAGSTDAFCFGDNTTQLHRFAIFFDSEEVDDKEFSAIVGRRSANDWGIFDMHGNVSELVIEDSAKTGLDLGHVACGGNFLLDADQCKTDSVLHTDWDWWDDDPSFPLSPHWMTSEDARATGFRIISPLSQMRENERKVAWEADSERLKQDIQSYLENGRGSIGRIKPTLPQ
ncbi:MAG: formylglycine-generating enzyme family protein [Planctomycetota bacterium]